MKNLIVVFAGVSLLISCNGLKSKRVMVWQDEFDTSQIDKSKWTFETGGDGFGNNELQFYTRDRKENARVEDGNLIIEARKE